MSAYSNLILFGFKNSGKTHFGRLLQQTFAIPFIDLDQQIEAFYFQENHERLSCREIATHHGMDAFRKWEKKALFSCEKMTHTLIALGGGTLLDQENLSFSLNLGNLVYLDVDKDTLMKRTLSPPLPSYIDVAKPKESFEKLYLERLNCYKDIPCKRILLKGKSQSEILEQLIDLYRGKPDGK